MSGCSSECALPIYCRWRTCHLRAALAGTLRLPPWSRRSHRCANPVIGKRQGRPESHRPGQGCTGSTEAWLLSSDVSRSEEHTSELQSLMRISYAVFCLKKKKILINKHNNTRTTRKN